MNIAADIREGIVSALIAGKSDIFFYVHRKYKLRNHEIY